MAALDFDVDISITERGRKVAYSLDKDLGGKLTLKRLFELQREILIATAVTVLREEQAKGFDKKPRILVDRKPDRNIKNVKAFGRIDFFARVSLLKQLIPMYDEILKRSIVVTGQYKASNFVLFNNQVVARSRAELADFVRKKEKEGINNDSTITFINFTPYARKLERYGYSKQTRGASIGETRQGFRLGYNKRSNSFFVKPNGAYWLAHRAIKNKFKNVTEFVRFKFASGEGFNITPVGGQRTNFAGKNGRPYLYPTIEVRFSPLGVNDRS